MTPIDSFATDINSSIQAAEGVDDTDIVMQMLSQAAMHMEEAVKRGAPIDTNCIAASADLLFQIRILQNNDAGNMH